MSETWKIRDKSWAPTTSEVPVDTIGAQGFGKCGLLVKRPYEGKFSPDCFEFVNRPVPEILEAGTVLIQNLYLSMDPTNLIWAQEIPQYMPAVGLGTVMRCGGVGKVVKTTDEEKLPVGTFVSTLGLAEFLVSPIASVNPVVPGVPLSYNLGPFSLVQGHTAWIGYKICDPKAGETIVVSGAAGAVGSLAGQLAKRTGARVIGVAGGPDKCRMVKEEFGFDDCLDYKGSESIVDGLKRLCPNGIDSYFDNVGGETLDAVLSLSNCYARIAFCGAISTYTGNMGSNAMGPKNFEMILMRRLTIQGFICVDHLASVPESFAEIGQALKAGQLKQKEDIREVDIESYVETVNNLFTGGNTGKLIIRLPAAVSEGV